MSYLDIILIIPLAWSVYKGFRRGLIIEIASLVGLILGIYGALNFSDFTESYLRANYQLDFEHLHLLSFALTFVGIVVIVYILGKILEKVINIVALGLLNKIAGLAFGVIKMALILSVLILIFEGINANTNLVSEKEKSESVLYRPIAGLVPMIMPLIEDVDWVSDVLKKSQNETKMLGI